MSGKRRDALKERAGAAIEAQGEALRGVAIGLNQNPELSYREVESARRLTAFLAGRGFTLEAGVGGLETAFKATLDSGTPGPTICFIAEYDALPGVGHGCGHNLIAAGALGAGIGAAAVLPELGGKIVVFGTPAEEYSNNPQGKIVLLEAGAFEGLDACLMFHPWPFSAPINSSLAFIAFDVVFHGQTAHAAADPWNGRNALDAVIMLFNGISHLRQQVQPDVRIHGIVTDGGVAPNIIPERAAARFMLRARKFEQVQRIFTRVKACVEGAALATGTTVDLDVRCQTADTLARPTLQALTRANFEALGAPFGPATDWTASTDFGDVSYRIPSDSFFLSLEAGPMPWHSTDVARAAIQEPALRSMVLGAKVLALTAIDLLDDPALLARARGES